MRTNRGSTVVLWSFLMAGTFLIKHKHQQVVIHNL